MVLESIKQVYFVGIGGIGMSAIARYFNEKGFKVGGYDRVESELTKRLNSEGLYVTYDDKVVTIPLEYMDRETTLVVYTPAVPSSNRQLSYFRNHNFRIGKRSEVLGLIAKSSSLIGISGTHGKTTVSTMVSYLLKKSSVGCSAFLGGISKNFDSNLVISDDSKWIVMEADEYDRSFLKLFPDVAVVTSVDADHLDIYGNHSEIKKTFNEFIGQINKGGCLIHKYGLEFNDLPEITYTYSLDNYNADFHARNLRLVAGAYEFDLHTPDGVIESLRLNYPGKVNIENAVVAMAVALHCGVSAEELYDSISDFEGVVRRFDIRFKSDNYIYIDDYAHHPKELEAVISSVKELYFGRKITGIFQPHLYSRTKDFADDFAKSLGKLDNLILLDIYPAREEPIPGVNSGIIADKMDIPTLVTTKEELLDNIETVDGGVLLTLGAGDIDRFVKPISNILDKKFRK